MFSTIILPVICNIQPSNISIVLAEPVLVDSPPDYLIYQFTDNELNEEGFRISNGQVAFQR